MSEEEKQAIEYLKDVAINNEYWSFGKLENSIKIVLNLIDKLQKETVELKAITQNYNAIGGENFGDDRIVLCSMKYFNDGYFKRNYIFKYKIKAKIKELENKEFLYKEEKRFNEEEIKFNYAKRILQELLGEEDE